MRKATNTLDLTNLKSRERIKELINQYYKQMLLLNEDSEESLDGGGVCYYKVKIEFDEIWT